MRVTVLSRSGERGDKFTDRVDEVLRAGGKGPPGQQGPSVAGIDRTIQTHA